MLGQAPPDRICADVCALLTQRAETRSTRLACLGGHSGDVYWGGRASRSGRSSGVMNLKTLAWAPTIPTRSDQRCLEERVPFTASNTA